jgi:hypothetical protein
LLPGRGADRKKGERERAKESPKKEVRVLKNDCES